MNSLFLKPFARFNTWIVIQVTQRSIAQQTIVPCQRWIPVAVGDATEFALRVAHALAFGHRWYVVYKANHSLVQAETFAALHRTFCENWKQRYSRGFLHESAIMTNHLDQVASSTNCHSSSYLCPVAAGDLYRCLRIYCPDSSARNCLRVDTAACSPNWNNWNRPALVSHCGACSTDRVADGSECHSGRHTTPTRYFPCLSCTEWMADALVSCNNSVAGEFHVRDPSSRRAPAVVGVRASLADSQTSKVVPHNLR